LELRIISEQKTADGEKKAAQGSDGIAGEGDAAKDLV
jgi:hypothetical protein